MSDHLGERVLAFVEGTLDAEGGSAALRHVERCAECRAEVRRVRAALAALAAWPAAPALPHAVQQSLLARYENTVMPRVQPAKFPRAVLQAAATVVLALLCGAAGYALGAARPAAPDAAAPASMPLFMLLLEEHTWPDPSRPRSGYMEWAQSLRAESRLDRGEKLTDEPGWRIDSAGNVTRPAEGTRPTNVSGWFLVRAASYEAAIDLVRQGPHLRYGSVLVRQIE